MLARTVPAIAAAAFLAALSTAPVLAADHEVKMLNRGEAGMMVFEPAYLEIEPGDTVRFVAADRSHNAQSIDGMLPEGAEPFAGAIDEEIEVTFNVEGIYGYECRPHHGMGMVGLIVVGSPDANLSQARQAKLRGKGRQVMQALFEQVDG